MPRFLAVAVLLLIWMHSSMLQADEPRIALKLLRSSDKSLETDNGHNTAVYSLRLAPDGKRVLVGGDIVSPIVVLWNIETAENDQFYDIFAQEDGGTIGATISPDGKIAGITTTAAKVFFFDTATGNLLKKFDWPQLSIFVRFSPDSKRAAFADLQGQLTIIDCANEKTPFAEVGKIQAHNDVAGPVAWNGNGSHVITGSRDNTVRIWNSKTLKEVHKLTHPEWVWSCVYSYDSKLIATGTGGGMSGAPLSQNYLVGNDNIIRLWDAEKGTLIRELKGHTDRIHCLEFTRDSKLLASGSFDKTLRLWDVETGKELARATGKGWVTTLDITADSKTIVAGGGADKIGNEWLPYPEERLRVFAIER